MSVEAPVWQRVLERIDKVGAPLCVGLDPRPARVPAQFRNEPDPILAWNRAIIEATADLAAAYKPNSAFYEALGPGGWVTLKRTIEAIPSDIPVILDAKRGDIGSTAEAYAHAVFDELDVDLVTLSPYLGRDSITPFLAHEDKGVFLLCHTSNPGAQDLQRLPVCPPDRPPVPLYEEVARRAMRWDKRGQIGLVVGAPYPEVLREIRRIAPETWFLVPGVGAQGGTIEELGEALRADGRGVLVNVSRGIGQADDPRAAAIAYVERLRALRPTGGSPPPADTSISFLLSLAELGAIQRGVFRLASGKTSTTYIDLRLLVSAPTLLAQAAQLYARHIRRLKPDLIAAVPYAALPIATAVSLHTGVPMIYTRKEVKDHGLARDIEGLYFPGQRVVIVEDLVTTGGSVLRTVEQLRAVGLIVEDVVVLIDREEGAAGNLKKAGVRLHATFRLSDVLSILASYKVGSDDERFPGA